MIEHYKDRELSYRHFLDAVEACRGVEDSKYFKEQLTLVGVYYDNPLEDDILAEPRLSLRESEDGKSIIDIILEPDDNQRDGLDILSLILHQAGIGEVTKDNPNLLKMFDEYYEDDFELAKDYFSRNTILEQVNDYDLSFVVTEPKVRQRQYTINKQPYYAYEITSKGLVGEEEYIQKLYVLFKEKQYDGEAFLTQFIDEKITKSDGIKILETMANKNLSSQAIGTVAFQSNKETTFNGYSVAYTSPSRLFQTESTYSIETLETRVVFNEDDIKEVQVTMNEDKTYYIIAIETKQNTLNIYVT